MDFRFSLIPPSSFPGLTRRATLLAAMGWLALPAAGVAATPSPSAPWPNASQVPGGVARLPLGPAAQRPLAYTGEIPLLVLGDANGWAALVGIALSAPPGEASITVQAADGTRREIPYVVAPKRYREQQLKVEPRTVDLSPEDLARYERERAHQEGVMATFSQPLPQGSLRMQVPVPGGDRVLSGCGASSTASRATRTAAWTSRPPPARRWCRRCPRA
jgi:hypothetical protein